MKLPFHFPCIQNFFTWSRSSLNTRLHLTKKWKILRKNFIILILHSLFCCFHLLLIWLPLSSWYSDLLYTNYTQNKSFSFIFCLKHHNIGIRVKIWQFLFCTLIQLDLQSNKLHFLVEFVFCVVWIRKEIHNEIIKFVLFEVKLGSTLQKHKWNQILIKTILWLLFYH